MRRRPVPILVLAVVLALSSGLTALGTTRGSATTGDNLFAAKSPAFRSGAGRMDGAGYTLVKTYQSSPRPPLGVLLDPVGLHVADDNTVFVVDRALHRAQRYTPDGVPLTQYGRLGDGPGELYRPAGIAADLVRDRVYVVDRGNDRLAVFQLDGTPVADWGPFVRPEAVAVGRDGRVYLMEPDRATVNILLADQNGAKQGEIFVAAQDMRRTGGANGLAMGPDGRLYVATTFGVRRFDPNGVFRGDIRLYPGEVPIATRGVTVDAAGQVYVLEAARLTRKMAGGLVLSIPLGRGVQAIAGGAAGHVYFALAGSADQPGGVALRHFDGVRQTPLARWGIPLAVLGWLDHPLRIALGGDGDVYVVDEQRRVQRFSPDLEAALGQFVAPGLQEASALPNGDLLVARTRYGSSDEDPEDEDTAPAGMRRVMIERYDLGGQLSAQTPAVGRRLWRVEQIEPIAAPGSTSIVAMDVDGARERLMALDGGGQRVLVFGSDGTAYPSLALPKLEAGLPGYIDLAVGPDGAFYALHSSARRVYRFAADGTVEGHWLTPEWPWRLAVGLDGTLFVPTADRRVWAFSPEGSPQTTWSLPAPHDDEPGPPSDIAVAPDGRVYVLDHAGTAIYLFAPTEGGALDLPPAKSLHCDVHGSVAVDPPEVLAGDPAEVTLTLVGSCPPHRRTGEVPGALLRMATVSVTLPSGVELLPGSIQPPATIEGPTVHWELAEVPADGVALRYAITARQSSRYPVFAQGNVNFLDGWFSPGQLTLTPVPFYTLLPSTPTPPPTPWWQARRRYLPVAGR